LADETSTPEPTITPEVPNLIRYANYGGTGYLVFDLTGIDLSQVEQSIETNSLQEDKIPAFIVILNDEYEVSCELEYLDPDSKLPPIKPLEDQEPNVLFCDADIYFNARSCSAKPLLGEEVIGLYEFSFSKYSTPTPKSQNQNPQNQSNTIPPPPPQPTPDPEG
jgi:hypothetical protein